MKKTIAAILLLSVCLCSLFACGTKHPIDELRESIIDEKNAQITISLSDIPLFGSMQITTKVDGDKTYTSGVFGSSETYTEVKGDTVYTYAKDDDGNWKKTSEKADASKDTGMVSGDEMDVLFNSENYTQSKDDENKYFMKEDVVLDGYSEITLTIIENGCIIEGKMNSEGFVYTMKMTFSNIGSTKITLPEVK